MQKVEVKIIATDNNYNMNLQQPSLIYINNIVWCKFKITPLFAFIMILHEILIVCITVNKTVSLNGKTKIETKL
jgi:hypothetical protein